MCVIDSRGICHILLLQFILFVIVKPAGGSTLKIEIHEIHEIHQNLRNPVPVTCLNQQRQPPTLSGGHTWTVDETKVASSLNFSILIKCSLLFACDCVDFVSSAEFRGSH